MTLDRLPMEIRSIDESERIVTGVIAPYGEMTYLTPNPKGERITAGAFAKSIRQRGDKIPLFRNHDHSRKLGTSIGFRDDGGALVGEFRVLEGGPGDDLISDVRAGYLDGMSVGMQVLTTGRTRDGATEVREARLVECSIVALPAYEGSGMLSVRSAAAVEDLLAPFANPPAVNLAPIPPIGYLRR